MSYTKMQPTTMLAPLPCAMVSVSDEKGRTNIMTVAWTGVVNTKPPMVSISVKPSRYSHPMIMESGEFCLHPVDREHVKALDFCGVTTGKEHDKLKETGLKTMDVGMKTARGIDGLPLCLCCELRNVLPLGSHDLMIAEVKSVFVRDDLLDEQGGVHLERTSLVAYSHGLYQELGEVLGFFGFSVARPEIFQQRMKQYVRS